MMNSSGNMDSSQSDISMRDEDCRLSDVESQHSEQSPTNNSSRHGHGHLSASPDRYEISASTNDPLSVPRKGFNKNRKIIIKNIPPVRYEEVKDFLGSYGVSNISISKRARHAVATLMHGEQAESAVEELNGRNLMGTTVNVTFYPNECLLCVAHLPLNLDEADFRNMVGEFGAIERAFLMVNKEGRSKGYGFVEFAHNKELSTQARNMLDGKRVGSCMLHCDFLDTSIVSFEHLQSRCLYIDHLPPGYDNEMELRNIFSFIKTPTFFRLHSPVNPASNKAMGSFAVVEYENHHVAEDTQKQGNGLLLCQQRIRVTFCLPGRPGIDIFSTLLAAHSNTSKQALLPNPPTIMTSPTRDSLTNPLVFNLLAQNPLLLQNFQKVLQHLHQQTQPPTQKPGLLGMAPNLPSSPLMNPNLQVALLAVMLAMQLQQFEPSLVTNSQLQAMIASNLQNEQNNSGSGTRPSLLGNPMIAQANSLLQNLAAQQGSVMPTLPSAAGVNSNISNVNINQLNNWGQLLGLIQAHLSGNAGPTTAPENKAMLSPPDSGQGLLGDAPVSGPIRKGPLLGVAPSMNMKPGLLGDAPQHPGSLGRPILGSGAVNDSDKRNLLSHNQQALFVDAGAKENMIVGPANPLLAIFLEGHIRQQLDSLRSLGGGPGPGLRGPPRYGAPPPNPHGPPPPNPHGPPPNPHGPPPNPHGPLPNPHGPPPPHLLGPGQRPLAQRRPPRLAGPTTGGSLLGQPHFLGNGRMPGPHVQHGPPPTQHNPGLQRPPGQQHFNKPLLPNPVLQQMNNQMSNHMDNPINNPPNNQMTNQMNSQMDNHMNNHINNPVSNQMMGPPPSRKLGLLGEHPGAPPPQAQKRQWQPDEGPSRNNHPHSRPSSILPEKRGLLGDAPSNILNMGDYGNRPDGNDQTHRLWMENGNHNQGNTFDNQQPDDWGKDLWENNPAHRSNLPSLPSPTDTNNTSDSLLDSSPYVPPYQTYMNPYSQPIKKPYHQGVGSFNSQQEALLSDGPHGALSMPPPKTPMVGSKRSRSHLLPSPETSPEGVYIGQHSQGLGGHYATSYIKKRRLM